MVSCPLPMHRSCGGYVNSNHVLYCVLLTCIYVFVGVVVGGGGGGLTLMLCTYHWYDEGQRWGDLAIPVFQVPHSWGILADQIPQILRGQKSHPHMLHIVCHFS